MRAAMRTALLGWLAAACGCAGIPDGVEAVRGFELERYLGTWYEIARLDHRFERGLTEVTATYGRRDDGGIEVINRGFDPDTGEWDVATGKGFFVGDADLGRLKVSFFGPVYGGYNVIALDRDGYGYAMVAGSDRDYLWILSRTKELEPRILEELVQRARELGFPVEDLIYVEHGEAPPPPPMS